MFRSPKDAIRTPVKTKTTQNTFKCILHCDMCTDGPWPTESDLEIHRKKAHKAELIRLFSDDKNFMCGICLHPQKDKPTFIEHIKTRHLLTKQDSLNIDHEVFICNYCECLFFNKKFLEAHIIYTHLITNQDRQTTEINCPKCMKPIKAKLIWFHLLHHGILNSSTCSICLEPFEWHLELLEHVKNHLPYLFCAICGYETKNETNFHKHTQGHRNNLAAFSVVENYSMFFLPRAQSKGVIKTWSSILKGITLPDAIQICIICRAIFDSKDTTGMMAHINSDHAPEPIAKTVIYKCKCGEIFINKVMLKYHVLKLKGLHKEDVSDENTTSTLAQNTQTVIEQVNTETIEPLPTLDVFI